MKRIGAFILAFILSALSIFIYFPSFSFAADDVTVIPLVEGHFGLSEADAQSKVSAHKDIYFDNNTRAFAYTPGTSYNWTLCDSNGAVTSTHLSDKQVVALLCSSNRMDHNRTLISSFISNNNIFRGFMSGVGSIFTGDSDNGTKLLDIVTGNYNYLDSLSYDEDSQTIIMSNDNGSVDKLREEIKKYYYDSIGIGTYPCSGKVTDFVNSGLFSHYFEYEEDYTETFNAVAKSKYCLADFYANGSSQYSNHAYFYDSSDYIYLSNDEGFAGTSSSGNIVYRLYSYNNGTSYNLHENKSYYYYYGLDNGLYDTYSGTLYGLFFNPNGSYYKGISPCLTDTKDSFKVYFDYVMAYPVFHYVSFRFYSFDGSPLLYFKSYSSMYNYINGDQTAYLSSQINQTGQDISFSINDMNDNLGSKMDELIVSINSGKASMSQDELQDAIDKGLEELNKNTEEIKDNTAEMNNKLDELIAAVNQGNDTLLEILGVTEYIAYSTTKDDGSAYTLDDLFFSFGSIYDALGNAILYGVNTLDADASSASYSSSAYSLSSAALLSDDDSGNSGSGGSVCNSGSGNSGSGGHIDFEYRNGLFGHFPFSVPYQLYEWLQVLKATPKCPEFTYNYGFLIGHKDEDAYSITFDLSAYQDWADNCKSFLRLSFTLLFAVGVFNKLKGVM